MIFCKNKDWRINGGVGFLALLSFLILAAPLSAQDVVTRATLPSADVYSNIMVTRVLGLETLELENGEKVQLIGIDYPEIYMRLPQGQEAVHFLKGLVEGKKVRLEYDVEKRGRNGRLLAYVFIDMHFPENAILDIEPGYYIDRDTLFVNATILWAGFAAPVAVPPNIKYAELFQKIHQEAKENKRGWWQEKERVVAPPTDYRALADACKDKDSESCCMLSVKRMEAGQYKLGPQDGPCPEGFKPNMYRCPESYRWCEPSEK